MGDTVGLGGPRAGGNELELFEQLDETPWVTLAKAEAETGVSRSALRSSYATARSGPGWSTARTDRSAWCQLDAVIERRRVTAHSAQGGTGSQPGSPGRSATAPG